MFKFFTRPGVRPLLLVSILATLAGGCVALVDYKPKEDAVSEMGAGEAKSRLRSLLLAAKSPRITSVEVEDDVIIVKTLQQTGIGAFYQPIMNAIDYSIVFETLSKVEVYANNASFIYGPGGRLDMKVVFGTPEDTRTFADLMWSFHVQNMK